MQSYKPKKGTIECPACKQQAGQFLYQQTSGQAGQIHVRCPSPNCGHDWNANFPGVVTGIRFGSDPATHF
jgi:DNA-directed RNA polymerase subunit M/transcription elongation factor TFIIS